VNFLLFFLLLMLGGCSTIDQTKYKNSPRPGMSEDAQDINAGGYVN